MKVVIHNWKYFDGWRDFSLDTPKTEYLSNRIFDEDLQGWHCHAYTTDDLAFDQWMAKNMKGRYDCTFRFNSGNPYCHVWISSAEDATFFKITFMGQKNEDY